MKKRKQTILVTGATGGIGREIARNCGVDGATIIAVGRKKKELLALKNEIETGGGTCCIYSTDLSRERTVNLLCRTLKKEFKSIDWVIFAAGTIDTNESMGHIQRNTRDAIFSTNLFSIFTMTAALLPIIRGGFVHISSTAGLWGNGRKPIYASSKGALNAFGKSLSWYMKDNRKNLSSIVICSGPTNTPMRQKTAGDAKKHQSPRVIAEVIEKIVGGKNKYKNGDVILVHNGKALLQSRLT